MICVLDHGAGRGRQGERYDAVAFVQNSFFFSCAFCSWDVLCSYMLT